MDEVKYVPDTLVVGPHGLPVVRQGYTEIGGLRFFGDRVVVGSHGQHVLETGRMEMVRPTTDSWRR